MDKQLKNNARYHYLHTINRKCGSVENSIFLLVDGVVIILFWGVGQDEFTFVGLEFVPGNYGIDNCHISVIGL